MKNNKIYIGLPVLLGIFGSFYSCGITTSTVGTYDQYGRYSTTVVATPSYEASQRRSNLEATAWTTEKLRRNENAGDSNEELIERENRRKEAEEIRKKRYDEFFKEQLQRSHADRGEIIKYPCWAPYRMHDCSKSYQGRGRAMAIFLSGKNQLSISTQKKYGQILFV